MSRAWLNLKVELEGHDSPFPKPEELVHKLRDALLGTELEWTRPDYPVTAGAVIDVVQVDGEPVIDDEPASAGRDPWGRPNPATHPEYWTE